MILIKIELEIDIYKVIWEMATPLTGRINIDERDGCIRPDDVVRAVQSIYNIKLDDVDELVEEIESKCQAISSEYCIIYVIAKDNKLYQL